MSCTTSHNILLQFAAETGIIGLIFYFGTLIYLIVNFFKAFNRYLRTKNKVYFFQISLILCIFNYLSLFYLLVIFLTIGFQQTYFFH